MLLDRQCFFFFCFGPLKASFYCRSGFGSLHFSSVATVIGTCDGARSCPANPLPKDDNMHELQWIGVATATSCNTDLSDMKNTGLQIHCRFYKKNDKAGILSKCLCRERDKKSDSFEQAHSITMLEKISRVILSPFLPQIESLQFYITYKLTPAHCLLCAFNSFIFFSLTPSLTIIKTFSEKFQRQDSLKH